MGVICILYYSQVLGAFLYVYRGEAISEALAQPPGVKWIILTFQLYNPILLFMNGR